MSDFKTKMHQIRIRLGLRPRPRWGSLQRSPSPLAGFGALLLTGVGRRKEGREGEEGREGLSLPKVNFLITSLIIIMQRLLWVRHIRPLHHWSSKKTFWDFPKSYFFGWMPFGPLPVTQQTVSKQ